MANHWRPLTTDDSSHRSSVGFFLPVLEHRQRVSWKTNRISWLSFDSSNIARTNVGNRNQRESGVFVFVFLFLCRLLSYTQQRNDKSCVEERRHRTEEDKDQSKRWKESKGKRKGKWERHKHFPNLSFSRFFSSFDCRRMENTAPGLFLGVLVFFP